MSESSWTITWSFGGRRQSQSPFPHPCITMRHGFKYIRQAARRLRDEYDSDVPRTVDELCSLPTGVVNGFFYTAWGIFVIALPPFFSAASKIIGREERWE